MAANAKRLCAACPSFPPSPLPERHDPKAQKHVTGSIPVSPTSGKQPLTCNAAGSEAVCIGRVSDTCRIERRRILSVER